jgi:subtilisin family serine protease
VAGGVSILSPDELEEGSFTDVLGHGTAVMAAIQEKAPDAEYFAVKLFHNSLRTTTPALLSAIEWAIAKRVDVVNLSLGTLNFDYKNQFQEAVERAAAHGIVLVSAREADGKACLPGVLPGVIGVGLDWDCPRNRCRVAHDEGGVHYFASGYPRSLPGMPKERNLRGISFAVANMTGLVLCARESCSAQQIHETLAAECAVASEPPVPAAEP